MEYSKLVSVTGLPGLFELIASKADGAIVRSLDDKSTKFVSSRIHNFSHLESIEVYTEGENVNLVDVFNAMQNSKENLPDEKDATAVKAYFKKIYPTMDFERVYASDMKKMVRWFDVLKKNNVEIKLTESEEETQGEIAEAPEQQAEEVKTEPKKAAKESVAKEKETKQEKAETKEEPKKIKAAKAKKEEAATAKEETPAETEPKAARKKITKK